MLSFISWYLLITFVGLLAFPLAYRLLPNLPDRGYNFARPLGLLVWGYGFWLLASFRFLQNDSGGILLALALLAGLSFLAVSRCWQDFRSWLREHAGQIWTSELIFLALFIAWALVRAMNPDVAGTEKPMEQAFINAILRSPVFPPHDPWLSGYAISYYYFGYVLVAMLTQLTGVTSGVAFNLSAALWFALTALAAYGVLYNLLALRFGGSDRGRGSLLARGWALLAPFFLLLVSNLEGFLEMLHANGAFWGADGRSSVWSWLGIQELVNPPHQPYSWVPERVGGIWWWRASRVVSDYTLRGDYKEVIDEFPFFSYTLADLHPHVLAMPFALLIVALALNFYLFARQRILPNMGLNQWLRLWTREDAPNFWTDTRVGAWIRTPGFWLAALALGGMAFINTWDFPIYIALFSAAYVLARYQREGWGLARLGEFIELAVILAVPGVILYLPFYFGFQSQAGGFLPSLSFFTRGIHFWIMFGSLLVPVILWLVFLWSKRGGSRAGLDGLKFGAVAVFGLWLLSYFFAALITLALSSIPRFASLGSLFYDLQGADNASELLLGSMLKRLDQPGTWLFLFLFLAVVWGLLSTFRASRAPVPAGAAEYSAGEDSSVRAPVDSFVLLLILLGSGLILVPEFIYLRDQFGGRMNTIFKFYFQAWVVLSLAAAYASVMIWKLARGVLAWVARLAWVAVVLMSLAYTVFGLRTQTDNFNTAGMTLDGNAYRLTYEPDEMDAINWLRQAPPGVVAEAIGGQYSPFARVSMLSGQPTVLGWPGHESQWRGGATEMGTREADIESLYSANNWPQALQIIQRYNIRYIYVGSLERSAYHVSENKFQANLKPAYQNNSVVIYEVPGMDLLQSQAGG